MPFAVETATFLERPNRFVIHARLHSSGETVRAHCPNPGRMAELMIPGATVYLSRATDPARRTPFTLRFMIHPEAEELISLDTQLPNNLFAEGLAEGFFAPFRGHRSVRREVSVPHGGQEKQGKITSRVDFLMEDAQGRPCWVEVKSVSLVEEGLALFPDAPTTRGRRHLLELADLAQAGERAAVVFIVQRPDAVSVQPNRRTDPDFADALTHAQAAGVEVYAYTCAVSVDAVTLETRNPGGEWVGAVFNRTTADRKACGDDQDKRVHGQNDNAGYGRSHQGVRTPHARLCHLAEFAPPGANGSTKLRYEFDG